MQLHAIKLVAALKSQIKDLEQKKSPSFNGWMFKLLFFLAKQIDVSLGHRMLGNATNLVHLNRPVMAKIFSNSLNDFANKIWIYWALN